MGRIPSLSPPCSNLLNNEPTNTMQSLKLDLTKFNNATRFTSKSGVDHIAIPLAANGVYVGEKGAYLEITLLENKDGPNEWSDGFAAVNLSKEQRQAGERGPIVGNWKHVGQKPAPQPRANPKHDAEYQRNAEDGDDIPF